MSAATICAANTPTSLAEDTVVMRIVSLLVHALAPDESAADVQLSVKND